MYEGTDEVKIFQRRVGSTREHWKLHKKQLRFDAGKFSFRNQAYK